MTFDQRPALGREAFFVAPSNAMAVALIDRPERWSPGKLVLTGPEGSGKTHLLQVWAGATGARILSAAEVAGTDIAGLSGERVGVEDVPRIAGDLASEEALFHLHNLLMQSGGTLLMTGRPAPGLWGLRLPDLQSRVDAALAARLDLPDDDLLAAILFKLFEDRQLNVQPELVSYLVARIERSFSAALDIVDRLDRASLRDRRPINRRLAADVLGAGRDPA